MPQFLQEGPVFGITNEECDEIHFGIIRESHICAGTGGDGWPNACNVSLCVSGSVSLCEWWLAQRL